MEIFLTKGYVELGVGCLQLKLITSVRTDECGRQTWDYLGVFNGQGQAGKLFRILMGFAFARSEDLVLGLWGEMGQVWVGWRISKVCMVHYGRTGKCVTSD